MAATFVSAFEELCIRILDETEKTGVWRAGHSEPELIMAGLKKLGIIQRTNRSHEFKVINRTLLEAYCANPPAKTAGEWMVLYKNPRLPMPGGRYGLDNAVALLDEEVSKESDPVSAYAKVIMHFCHRIAYLQSKRN